MSVPINQSGSARPQGELVLSVIVVNWKVRDFLRECLRTLYEQTRLPSEQWELLVVDNDSCDGSVEMLREEFPRAEVLVNKQNVGFARAHNQAVALGRGRPILLRTPARRVLARASWAGRRS